MRLGGAIMLVISCACDAARDASYPGEPLHTVAGRPERLAITMTPDVRLGLFWVSDVVIEARPDDIRVASLALAEFELEVLRPPPSAALRTVVGDDAGALAVGVLAAYRDHDGDGAHDPDEPFIGTSNTMIAFTPDGVAGQFTELAAGFHTVRASAPCDLLPVSFHEVPPDARAKLVMRDDFRPDMLWFDAGCLDEVTRVRLTPPFCVATRQAIRWVCRFGPGDPHCDYCLLFVFPEGATAETCDRWRVDWCGDIDEECGDEWRVCRAGEPPAVRSCDRACVCDALGTQCLEGGSDPDVCASKVRECAAL